MFGNFATLCEGVGCRALNNFMINIFNNIQFVKGAHCIEERNIFLKHRTNKCAAPLFVSKAVCRSISPFSSRNAINNST